MYHSVLQNSTHIGHYADEKIENLLFFSGGGGGRLVGCGCSGDICNKYFAKIFLHTRSRIEIQTVAISYSCPPPPMLTR